MLPLYATPIGPQNAALLAPQRGRRRAAAAVVAAARRYIAQQARARSAYGINKLENERQR